MFDNCYKKIGFSEENGYYSMKHLKKDKIFIVACNNVIEEILLQNIQKLHINFQRL